VSEDVSRAGRDRLYETREPAPFVFDAAVVEVFDDMIARSVPLFAPMSVLFAELAGRTVIRALAQALQRNAGEAAETGSPPLLIDVGCSSGTRTQRLAEAAPMARILGIDLSPDMIAEATAANAYPERVTYRCADAQETIPRCDVIVCSYTLQFVAPQQRLPLLRAWRDALRPGGVLLLAEKLCAEEETQATWIEAHEQFKRRQGYSEREIAAKRQALAGVLVPWTEQRWREVLHEAGFTNVAPLTRWLAFASFAVT
jgi:tRNA (cmo5U34)-methyltransferase